MGGVASALEAKRGEEETGNSDDPKPPEEEKEISDDQKFPQEEKEKSDNQKLPQEEKEKLDDPKLPQEEKEILDDQKRLGGGLAGPALRVHDVIIKGNSRTKDSVIEATMDDLKRASTLGEVKEGIKDATSRLWQLGVFDYIQVTLHHGPIELPDTVNVVVSVKELPQEKLRQANVTLDASATCPDAGVNLKWKNLLGLADTWEGSVTYNGVKKGGEFSTKVSLPRLGDWVSPVSARAYLGSQDLLKLSSYKQNSLGFALSLLDIKNHKLSYDLAWRTLTTDPSQIASKSVRRQLGHDLLSSIKYVYQVDKRVTLETSDQVLNMYSTLRPTRGYAYNFVTQLAGLYPDVRSARFLCQQFDLRYALPLRSLGKANAALNFGISGGIIIPWGRKLSIVDRIFMGGNSFSPVGSLGQLGSFSGFAYGGLGPSEPRRQTLHRDALGGDLALSAFANISFDLPVKTLRDAGIYGHVFACTGNLANVHDKGWRNFSYKNFLQTFRTSIGCGLVIPPKILPCAIELNFCHVLKKQAVGWDQGKTTAQVNFKIL
ncbi:hypothetical protein Cgig2_032724 [Carnegiea gigantea]|uniref:POTRA domain-containing protein n=1 Tax=Carnegiea gigantea TaxID=171969 RepID=A0A9Q1KHZ7_9CARY|nr:hypothetical protein Cgig2_032724 [Carnegiea gigantea]